MGFNLAFKGLSWNRVVPSGRTDERAYRWTESHTDGLTHTTNVIVAFRNFSKRLIRL